MAIHYVTGNTEYEDPENPYGSALAMKVGKSRLINNAQNYMDEGVATFFKYTNTDLFYEMDAIVERRTSIGMISFLTK